MYDYGFLRDNRAALFLEMLSHWTVMPRTTLLAALAGLIALAFVIVAAAWLWASTVVAHGWDAWVEERQAEGYRFTNAEPEVSGFPFRVVAELDSPVIEAPQGWRWDAPPIRAEAGLWTPFTLHFRAPGTHRFRLPDGRELEAQAENAAGHLAMNPEGGFDDAAMTLRNVLMSAVPLGPGTSLGQTTARSLDLRAEPAGVAEDQPENLAFSAVLRGLSLPEQIEVPFDREISTLGLDGVLLGRLPAEATEPELQRWRRDGGAVSVENLRLHWRPLGLQGRGRLSLDDALRPEGTLNVEARGLEEALARLSEAGLIEPRAATYGRLAVTALGERDQATGERVVQVPLSFQEGRFYLGPVPLFELSPVLVDRTNPLGALR